MTRFERFWKALDAALHTLAHPVQTWFELSDAQELIWQQQATIDDQDRALSCAAAQEAELLGELNLWTSKAIPLEKLTAYRVAGKPPDGFPSWHLWVNTCRQEGWLSGVQISALPVSQATVEQNGEKITYEYEPIHWSGRTFVDGDGKTKPNRIR